MLKKIALVGVALLLCSPAPSSGQVLLKTGAKGGLNFADLRTSSPSGPGLRNAPVGGAFATFDLQGTLALQSELLFTGKGFKQEGFGSSTTTLKLRYLELPLLLKFQAPISTSSQVNLYFGPTVAWKFDESLTISGTNQEFSPPDEDLAKTTDIGGAVGVEFGLKFGEGKALLDLRFTPGLTNIGADPEGDSDLELRNNASNQVFAVMLGYVFQL